MRVELLIPGFSYKKKKKKEGSTMQMQNAPKSHPDAFTKLKFHYEAWGNLQ